MRPLQRQYRKRDARLLASAQRADGLQARHAADLKVPQVLAVLLLRFSRELVREELDGVHRRNERVHVVLCKVAAATEGRGLMSSEVRWPSTLEQLTRVIGRCG